MKEVEWNGLRLRSPVDAELGQFQTQGWFRHWKPNPGDIVIDAGAYVGSFAIPAAYHVGEKGVVYAFEPEEEAFDLLSENLKLNPQIKNLFIYREALSDSDGEEKLFINPLNPQNGATLEHNIMRTHVDWKTTGWKTEMVRMKRLDLFLKSRGVQTVDFVKIDCEGGDHNVLKGLQSENVRKGTKFVIDFHDNLELVKRELERLNAKVISVETWPTNWGGELGMLFAEVE